MADTQHRDTGTPRWVKVSGLAAWRGRNVGLVFQFLPTLTSIGFGGSGFGYVVGYTEKT